MTASGTEQRQTGGSSGLASGGKCVRCATRTYVLVGYSCPAPDAKPGVTMKVRGEVR